MIQKQQTDISIERCRFLVRPTRFERATYRVGVCHSIQLSYERIFILAH